MMFSSWQFIFVFLPASLIIFFTLPATPLWPRKACLLIASLFFYAYWKVQYIPLLLFSIGVNYGVAEWLTRSTPGKKRKFICGLGVVVNLLLLGYYKYANFVAGIAGAAGLIRPTPHFDIILPLAISFFTFTQIGYLVDVYRDAAVHYRFFDYAVFVVFFPHLIAGPIVRHWEIIPQFASKQLRLKWDDVTVGMTLFLAGLYKKVLLADPLSGYVARVYDSAALNGTLTFFDAWMGTLSFALQIYFDFSGYSDMAIGLARMFTIRFPLNFDSPYQALSASDFWKRWHITLTRFFREYVYFPLGGNRRGPWRQSANIIGTMLLSGLWHGAGWTFVFWGGLHGGYLVIAHCWNRMTKRFCWEAPLYRASCWALTFAAVLLAWVFFRANDLHVAGTMLKTMLGANGLVLPLHLEKFFGPSFTSSLQNCGVRFLDVDLVSVDMSYFDFTLRIVVTLGIALLAANAQQLLARYAPTLELPATSGRTPKLTVGWATGLALGAMFVWVVRDFFSAPPSPFLYFNF